ncbi:MAG: prepilin peptidase, partial [Candidatus Paceibacterota bacterium]
MDYSDLAHIFVFLFGLIIGSFLNCVIYRLEEGKSFLKGRSFCPDCGHVLGFIDLVPVFSFIFLKGKCRYCGKRISWQYPLVELATGVIFLLVSIVFGVRSFGYIYYLLISSLLIIVFVYDLKHYIIPDGVIYTAIIASFLYNIVYSFLT